MRNSAFVAVASVVGEAFLATRNQVPVDVLKEKSQGQPAGKCTHDHPFANGAFCCADVDLKKCEGDDGIKIPCPGGKNKCQNFRRECTSIWTKGSCVANYCWWNKKGFKLLKKCKPKKTKGLACSADEECDRSLCERKRDEATRTCGSALPVDPYIISDSYLARIHEWHGMQDESGSIKYQCSTVTGKGEVRTLLAILPETPQSQGYAFLGFDVERASSRDYKLFKEIYTLGVKNFIDDNKENFANYDITFFGKDLGGLMATLARTEIRKSNVTPNKSRVFAFMEDENNLSALESNFILGEDMEDSSNLCPSTRIHGRPLVIQGSMRNAFNNPCSEYEGSFQVKRKTSWGTIVKSLGYGATAIGVGVAVGVALSNPLGLFAAMPLLLPLYLKVRKEDNKNKEKTKKKLNNSQCATVTVSAV